MVILGGLILWLFFLPAEEPSAKLNKGSTESSVLTLDPELKKRLATLESRLKHLNEAIAGYDQKIAKLRTEQKSAQEKTGSANESPNAMGGAFVSDQLFFENAIRREETLKGPFVVEADSLKVEITKLQAEIRRIQNAIAEREKAAQK